MQRLVKLVRTCPVPGANPDASLKHKKRADILIRPDMNRGTDYLVIGAGPTGIGAALRLEEQGAEWHMLEAADTFGGLASSFVDEAGFTWDNGGHVQFSHYETFDRYMDLALGAGGWLSHQRESWVWIRDRFVPYPFQNNLHRLDIADRWACVEGLCNAWVREKEGKSRGTPDHFEAWMLATFGGGVTDLFMRPYNFKVWAYPAHRMDFNWIGERVAVPDFRNVVKSICLNEDALSWGPNSLFRFPAKGGTGAVWKALGERLPPDRVSLSCSVTAIDADTKTVTTAAGDAWSYKAVLSTMPLNHLIRIAPDVVPGDAAGELLYSATNVVGVGLEGPTPDHLETKCWMYFPEANSPYYRVTVFSNYSPSNVPRPGEQWSLMTETSESLEKPVDLLNLVEDTVRALKEDKLIPDGTKILSTVHRRLEQGYPTPFKGRDDVVDPILRAFEDKAVYSRGRFGAWKYEVANQDHSFAQGYEWVERMIRGGNETHEPTVFRPSFVNSRRNP